MRACPCAPKHHEPVPDSDLKREPYCCQVLALANPFRAGCRGTCGQLIEKSPSPVSLISPSTSWSELAGAPRCGCRGPCSREGSAGEPSHLIQPLGNTVSHALTSGPSHGLHSSPRRRAGRCTKAGVSTPPFLTPPPPPTSKWKRTHEWHCPMFEDKDRDGVVKNKAQLAHTVE